MMRAGGIAVAALLCACNTRSATNPVATASVTDSAGTQIVVSTTPRWTDATRWRVDSIPITTIGGDRNDPQQFFQYVRLARRLSDGRVVIAVKGEARWFDSSGKYLMTAPRTGEGPGEYREISNLMHGGGDTLVVADGMGRKVTKFSPDGRIAGESVLDYDRYRRLGSWRECLSDVLPDGSRLGCLDDPTIPRTATNRPSVNGDPGPGLLRTMQRFYLVPPSLDTAYRIGLYGGLEQFGIASGSGWTHFYLHPLYATTYIASGGTPLRLAIALNPAYNIEIWTPQGKLERVVRRVGGRRAPTKSELADLPAELRLEMPPGDTANVAGILAAMPAADSLPAVIGLVFGPSGELAVQRDGRLPSQTASHFDIFDSAGVWLGTLQLPPRVRLLDIGPDFLLAVRTDADDVPHVEVYRLHR
jgi:hypothetical protein